MPGSGFWFFVLIIAINVVVGIVRKVAERRAAREAAIKAGTARGDTPPRGSPKVDATLQSGAGSFEVILERSGDRPMDVLRVLRQGLGMDPAGAMIAIGSTPTAIAMGLSRSDAGLLRNRLEEAGASVAVRRATASAGGAGPTLQPPAAAIERVDRQLERAMRREEQAAAAARAERARSAEQGAGSRRASGKKAAAPKAAAPKAPAPKPPPVGTSTTPALPPRPELPAAREASPSPWRVAQPTIASERTAARERGEFDAAWIREAAGDPRSLQRAFVLSELLQPPVSMRPFRSGGR
jgi:ribosomal protein L7/L12